MFWVRENTETIYKSTLYARKLYAGNKSVIKAPSMLLCDNEVLDQINRLFPPLTSIC